MQTVAVPQITKRLQDLPAEKLIVVYDFVSYLIERETVQTLPELIDLRTRGMNEEQAAELRARLATFAEDWDSPEMSIYDNYDAAKAKL
ncbi:MAG: hypothetical protein H8D43_04340 [Chloroflexi bacterium]|nr:hypothetical protein [Chloroflexota bacterium]